MANVSSLFFIEEWKSILVLQYQINSFTFAGNKFSAKKSVYFKAKKKEHATSYLLFCFLLSQFCQGYQINFQRTEERGVVMIDKAKTVTKKMTDIDREKLAFGEWNPGKRLLATIREYQKWRYSPGILGNSLRKAAVIQHVIWSVVCGADIPLDAQIGYGLLLPHNANGVVIHPQAIIGTDCILFHQVTIGASEEGSGLPIIGNNVEIGTGAKVLGGVTIGDGAKIGANAVVVRDVPAGATAVGIPARIITQSTTP